MIVEFNDKDPRAPVALLKLAQGLYSKQIMLGKQAKQRIIDGKAADKLLSKIRIGI